MDSFKVCQLIVVRVYTDAEEETGVSPVDYLIIAELDEVALVLLVARSNEAMDFPS